MNESQRFFNQDYVRFSIQMWNSEIRAKVLQRLQSLPEFTDLNIHEDDVSVMPFEEVFLDIKPGSIHQSISLMDQPSSYIRLNESIDFYFLCDLPSTATVMAEDFRRYPEFTLKNLQLALKCRGLALEDEASVKLSKSPTFSFNISVHRPESGEITGIQISRVIMINKYFCFSIRRC